ncbi:MAG: ATPase-like protein [Chloroflexi bacterium]|nr:ATPase-like protein [Chloroflexota bacterium]
MTNPRDPDDAAMHRAATPVTSAPRRAVEPAAGVSIRTPDQRLRVFVSSTLEELAPERAATREAIAQLRLTPILFETGARPYPPRALYRAYLAQSDIFIGLYGKRYGWVAPDMEISGLEDEYQLAGDKPRLIYIRKPEPEREPWLGALLDTMRSQGATSYHSFATPDELRDLVANDLAIFLTERFAGTASAPAQDNPSPLPAQHSSLIGRTAEMTEVAGLLRRQDVGLVTLTGPGGVGKTRLATQVATSVTNHFANGCAFVPLASLSEPDLLRTTIAQTLQVSELNDRSGDDSLLRYLRPKHMLLVLDNLEQLVGAAPQLAQLLEAAPQLKILATSREPLRVRNERTVAVLPLALPDRVPIGFDAAALDALARVPAVALFVERARQVQPDFALTAENAGAIIEICRRLDGLPLALELAAYNLRVLPPQAMLARLDRSLPLLMRGPRDLPARQQTLRNTMAWSYDLLDERGKTLFRRLGVFVGGFTLAAVKAVSTAEGSPVSPVAVDPPADEDLLEGVSSLVDISLVYPDVEVDGEPRFGMLVTIREYAWEQLASSGELAGIQRRFASYILNLAEAAYPSVNSVYRGSWMARLDRDDANMRAVLAWSMATTDESSTEAAQGSAGTDRSQVGVRLAGLLAWYWFFRGRLREGRHWLEEALARTTPGDNSLARGAVLNGAGLMAWAQGDVTDATTRAEEGLAIFRTIGDLHWLPYGLSLLASIRIAQEDFTAAASLLDESQAQHQEVGNVWGQAITVYELGNVAAAQGDLSMARSQYDKSLGLFRHMNDRLGMALALHSLGVTSVAQVDYAAARSLFAESLPLMRRTGDRFDLTQLLVDAGSTSLRLGDLQQARSFLVDGLRLARDIGLRTGVVLALAALAKLATAEGLAERAGRLYGAAKVLSPPAGRLRSVPDTANLDVNISEARSSLDNRVFTEGLVHGEALTEEAAIAYALIGAPPPATAA